MVAILTTGLMNIKGILDNIGPNDPIQFITQGSCKKKNLVRQELSFKKEKRLHIRQLTPHHNSTEKAAIIRCPWHDV